MMHDDPKPPDRRFEAAAELLLERLRLPYDTRDRGLVASVLAGIAPVTTHPVPLRTAEIKFAIGQAPAGVIQQMRQGGRGKREAALNQLVDLVVARFDRLQAWAPAPINGPTSPPSWNESRERKVERTSARDGSTKG